jgi:S1-C subfamily serine protease
MTSPAASDACPRSSRRPSRALRRLTAATVLAVGVGLVGFAATPAGAAPTQSSDRLDVDAVAEKVDPAVVDIHVTLANGQGEAAGTGMVVGSSGEVLTNNHVIENASRIRVTVGGRERTYSAEVLGYNVKEDVALLKLEGASGLETIETDTSVSVGEAVVAFGNGGGRGGTTEPTTGSVTAVDETITVGDPSGAQRLTDLIRIDAELESGDSGGPLVDADGEVVGINTAASRSGRFRLDAGPSTGYAIPIETALTIADQIESGEGRGDTHVGDRALLGVAVQDLGGRGLEDGSGRSSATVMSVQSGSPADDAGIGDGDVIVSLAGKTIDSVDDLASALAPHHPGDKVNVSWLDESGDRHSARVTLTKGPPA